MERKWKLSLGGSVCIYCWSFDFNNIMGALYYVRVIVRWEFFNPGMAPTAQKGSIWPISPFYKGCPKIALQCYPQLQFNPFQVHLQLTFETLSGISFHCPSTFNFCFWILLYIDL